MHARIVETVEPGMRKCDLVAEITGVGTRGVDGHGGDYPAIVPLIPSGSDAAAPHLTWDDRPLQDAARGPSSRSPAATSATTARCRARSFSASRPRPSSTPRRRCWRAWRRGSKRRAPGNVCEDIANAFFAVLKRYGIVKDNRTGYPIGLSYPPDWGERTMSLAPATAPS